jgi:hypothetical protein
MRVVITAFFATAIAFSVAGNPAAAQATKLWELAGFKAPESALPAPDGRVIYISNVAGQPAEKDGEGFISKVSTDGKMMEERWVTGLDAPKGMALVGGRLFVSDIDRLAEIDVAAGDIVARHEASGAKFLNDVAADGQGRVYVSDMMTNTIWRFADGRFEAWLQSAALKSPNGVLIHGDRLIVAAWGPIKEGFTTSTPGNLVEVNLGTKAVRDLGSGAPVGNLDGVEPLGTDAYLVTDWMNGALFRIEASGRATQLLKLKQGSADLGYMPNQRTALIPMMMDGTLVAYRID